VLIAIYYPKKQTLSYWIPRPNRSPVQSHAYTLKDEKAARAYLRDHIIKTEIVQEFEVFK
jgi:hypothetical protein